MIVVKIISPIITIILALDCPCEEELFDVTIPVDASNNKEVTIDVYNNVYTSASTFMKKQGVSECLVTLI
jgi:hypothetical protein